MKRDDEKSVSLENLDIGYIARRDHNILLSSLTATAEKGELVALAGRNGIGKSTLLRTIAGLQPSLGGSAKIGRKEVSEHLRMELALKLGYISTENVNFGNMRVYDLVALGRFPHTNWMGKIDQENHAIIIDALNKTSIIDLKDRYVSQISDGEKQKAMIARIIAQDARIMIMDEPTAFLDTGSRYEILHLMRRLSRDHGKTIIFSTHDLHMAISQADKIWLISKGKMEEGAPEDLMMNGSFDHLFDSPNVVFNSSDATFSFNQAPSGSVSIDGSGPQRFWLEKALNRIGMSVSEEIKSPLILLNRGEDKKYGLVTMGVTRLFSSVYEVIEALREEVHITV